MRINDEVAEPTNPMRGASARARSATRRRRSTRATRAWVAVGLIVLLLVGGGGIGVLVARQHADQVQSAVVLDLKQGVNDLQLAKSVVVKANSPSGDHTLLNEAIADFQSARSHFRHALDHVDSDFILRMASIVPGVGGSYVAPRLATVEAIARMGIDLADAGQTSTELDAALLNPGSASQKAGARILSVMNQAIAKAPAIKDALQNAQDEAAKVDLTFLPNAQRDSFLKAKGDIAKGLTDITEFEELAPAVIEFLGGNGKRTYLVEQPDPAEARAGGGFLGSYSLLTVNNGEIALGQAGDSYAIDYPYPRVGSPKYIQPPGPLRQFTGTQGYIFGDSNFLPDFSQTAQTGENLFTHETGIKVDGVISLDPFAVAGLLSVTGPIAIPEYRTTVDAATFAEFIFQQQEKTVANIPGRKLIFATVAAKLIAQVMTLPSSKWSQLIAALNATVTARHLMIYANDSIAQQELDRIGWSGAMLAPPTANETMLEVESNFGGNKVNHWLKRSYNLVLTVQGGKLHHALTISYRNPTPPGYLGGQKYACYVRFYIPAAATGARIEGPGKDRFPNDEQHPGITMLDGWFTIRPYGTARIGFEWDTPWDPSATTRIYWQKQAGNPADPIHITFLGSGKTYAGATDLGQDRVLVLSSGGLTIQAGAAGQAHLPLIGSQA